MQLLMKTYHIVQDLIKGKTCALFLTQEHQKKERYVPLLLSQEHQKRKNVNPYYYPRNIPLQFNINAFWMTNPIVYTNLLSFIKILESAGEDWLLFKMTQIDLSQKYSLDTYYQIHKKMLVNILHNVFFNLITISHAKQNGVNISFSRIWKLFLWVIIIQKIFLTSSFQVVMQDELV